MSVASAKRLAVSEGAFAQSPRRHSQDTQEPVTLTVPGAPVPKGRPRHTRAGHAYTPAKTRSYEAAIRSLAMIAMRTRPPITAPVKVEIVVDLPMPASWPRRRKGSAMAGFIVPAVRPDLDNLAKAALDAINGIVLADDGLVVELHALKRYALAPGMTITITPLVEVRRASS